MDIVAIFDRLSEQLKLDWDKARKAMQHPGLKGASLEDAFCGFVRDYFPKTVDVLTGILIDANGNSSRQADVIICDAAKTPIFYKSGNIRVVPIECAYAVIEVKAYLGNREVDDLFENMHSIRALEKKAYLKDKGPIIYTYHMYGQQWDIRPVNYFVFAIDSIDLMSLARTIDQRHEDARLPKWQHLDTICVLNQGVIFNKLVNGKLSALPDVNSELYVVPTRRALLLFYSLLFTCLNDLRLPTFIFTEYLGQLMFGANEPPVS